MKVYYNERPDRIRYGKRSDGYADVWIRDNIAEETVDSEEGELTQWTADEEYFLTSASYEEITAVQDGNYDPYKVVPKTDPEPVDNITFIAARLDAIEDAFAELVGEIIG